MVGQDVPEDMERDELDALSTHAVARLEGTVVGTGRLIPPGLAGPLASIGRMAVAEQARGGGIGAAVLGLLEATAQGNGWPAVELHAQLHAQRFYDRLGYAPVGEVYLEAGIEHVTMRKPLS